MRLPVQAMLGAMVKWFRHRLGNGQRILLGLLITLGFLIQSSGFFRLFFVERLDHWAYDARMALLAPGTSHSLVSIIDIDERSLSAEGHWPWRRDKVAKLFDQLFDHYNVAVAGADVVFPEPGDSSGLEVLQKLEASSLQQDSQFQQLSKALKPGLDRDAILSKALMDKRVILGCYFDTRAGQKAGALPAPVFMADTFAQIQLDMIQAKGYVANLPGLQMAAWSGGHFNPLYDADGVYRRIPMLAQWQDAVYESLSLAVVRAYWGDQPIHPIIVRDDWGQYGALEAIQIKDRRIPLDFKAAMRVSFRGPKRTFDYHSATDVLHGRVPIEQLKDRIVLIGTSAAGLSDLRTTPLGLVFPGVEVHANAVANILDGVFIHQPAYFQAVEFCVLLAIGLALSLWLPRQGAVGASLTALALMATVLVGNLIAWYQAQLDFPPVLPLGLIFSLYLLNMIYGFFIEARAKRQVADLFGQYVPPQVVEELQAHPELISMAGDNRKMTVLFSDVRNFTGISERLSAQELSALMNAYMTPMTEAIHRHGGTIDKYIGDAIMAFWGAPLADSGHARKALLGAMEMQRLAAELRAKFQQRGWPELYMGIGLNTGEMNVGNMGSQFRRAYTVLGDAVNLGSRLESISKQYGAGIVVSETTMAESPDVVFLELDRIRVKGKETAVKIYEPVALAKDLTTEQEAMLSLWQKMLHQYGAQQWDEAEALLERLSGFSDFRPKLAALYREHIRYFHQIPPAADWDGVFVYDSK